MGEEELAIKTGKEVISKYSAVQCSSRIYFNLSCAKNRAWKCTL